MSNSDPEQSPIKYGKERKAVFRLVDLRQVASFMSPLERNNIKKFALAYELPNSGMLATYCFLDTDEDVVAMLWHKSDEAGVNELRVVNSPDYPHKRKDLDLLQAFVEAESQAAVGAKWRAQEA